MVDMPRQPTLLTIPPELRLMIFEHVFPKLHYFGGTYHDNCPEAICVQSSQVNWEEPSRCPCSDRQLWPLYISKSAYRDIKCVVDRAEIEIDYSSTYWYRDLKPKFFSRVRKLILDEAIFPCVSWNLGNLRNISDVRVTFPNLKEIVMPEELGDGLGLRYPSSIPFHIYSCLRSRNGPESPPKAEGDLIEDVRSDVRGLGLAEHFVRTESVIEGAGSSYPVRIDSKSRSPSASIGRSVQKKERLKEENTVA